MKVKATLCFHVIHCRTGSLNGDLTGAGAPTCVVHSPESEPAGKERIVLWSKTCTLISSACS